MATSGAELRALVMNANAEAQTASGILRQAMEKLDEVAAMYQQISDKLDVSYTNIRNTVPDIEQAINKVNIAIRHADGYAATVA